LAALEADRNKFEALGAEILAINPASVTSHDNYCDKKGFTFTILSDPEQEITGKYEALKSNGKSIQRTVYVVGPDNKIIFAEKGMPANQKMLEAIEVNKD
jgi:peroxiredoxin